MLAVTKYSFTQPLTISVKSGLAMAPLGQFMPTVTLSPTASGRLSSREIMLRLIFCRAKSLFMLAPSLANPVHETGAVPSGARKRTLTLSTGIGQPFGAIFHIRLSLSPNVFTCSAI